MASRAVCQPPPYDRASVQRRESLIYLVQIYQRDIFKQIIEEIMKKQTKTFAELVEEKVDNRGESGKEYSPVLRSSDAMFDEHKKMHGGTYLLSKMDTALLQNVLRFSPTCKKLYPNLWNIVHDFKQRDEMSHIVEKFGLSEKEFEERKDNFLAFIHGLEAETKMNFSSFNDAAENAASIVNFRFKMFKASKVILEHFASLNQYESNSHKAKSILDVWTDVHLISLDENLQAEILYSWREIFEPILLKRSLWIEGEAGIGKTFLAKRILQEFLLYPKTAFDLVLYIPSRLLLDENASILSFLHDTYFPRESKDDFQTVLDSSQTLIIFDGYDEAPLKIKKELQEKILHKIGIWANAHYIIFTRRGFSLTVPVFWHRLGLRGLTSDTRRTFVRKHISITEFREAALRIVRRPGPFQELSVNPLFFNLLCNFLNLNNGKIVDDKKVEFFRLFTLFQEQFLHQEAVKAPVDLVLQELCRCRLNFEKSHCIRLLGYLAFDGWFKQSRKLLFDTANLKRVQDHLQLTDTEFYSHLRNLQNGGFLMFDVKRMFYHFPHRLHQDYFAANYCFQNMEVLTHSEVLELMETSDFLNDHSSFLCFLSGFKHSEQEKPQGSALATQLYVRFLKTHYKKITALPLWFHEMDSSILKCLSETLLPITSGKNITKLDLKYSQIVWNCIDELVKLLKQMPNLDDLILSGSLPEVTDTNRNETDKAHSALSEYFKQSKITVLYASACSFKLNKLTIVPKAFPKKKWSRLSLSKNDGNNSLSSFFGLDYVEFEFLKELRLSRCNLDAGDIVALCNVLPYCKGWLKYLSIGNTAAGAFTDSNVKKLADILKELSLYELHLCNNSLSASHCNLIVEAAKLGNEKRLSSRRESYFHGFGLRLSGNSFGTCDEQSIRAVFKALEDFKGLWRLDISNCSLTHHSVEFIKLFLGSVPADLREFYLENNEFTLTQVLDMISVIVSRTDLANLNFDFTPAGSLAQWCSEELDKFFENNIVSPQHRTFIYNML